jgi:hypothetical protein
VGQVPVPLTVSQFEQINFHINEYQANLANKKKRHGIFSGPNCSVVNVPVCNVRMHLGSKC